MGPPQFQNEPPPRPSAGLLIVIFGVLLLLLVLTIWLAHLNLQPWNGLVAMLIAAGKALLVALVFMHLRFSSRITWAFAAAGIVWLAIFFTLTLSDYVSRSWVPRMDNISQNIEIIPPPPGIKPNHIVPQQEMHPVEQRN